MPLESSVTTGLAFLVPVGYALIAASGLPSERSRRAAIGFFAALGLATLGYAGAGFALQFGGVGLVQNRAGLDGLIWEWSALGPTWGPGWGMAGLVGWGLSGPAATPDARALALANLPWVITAALVPVMALGGRAPAWASGLLGLAMGAVIYPVAGNWVWGGGWLANLGNNLGLGHGLVDASGAGTVHLLGAATAMAGILVLLSRKPRFPASDEPVPLPTAFFPLLSLLGAGLLLAGLLAWTMGNPLVEGLLIDPARLLLNSALAAGSGALLPLIYTWLIAGSPSPLMAVRGFAMATIAGMAAAPFVPAWSALVIGAAAGLLTPFAVFAVDRILRWDDPGASLTVHGLGGTLGVLAVGLFADGSSGAGWNGIGAAEYLGVARQGVTGLLPSAAFQVDWPGQMQAQLVGIAALALFGFFAAWLILAPLATTLHLLSPRRAPLQVASQPTLFDIPPEAATAPVEAAGDSPPAATTEAQTAS